MERIKPIRISKKDRKEFDRLERNTKSKIRRVKKKYGVDLTGEISLPNIDDFKTRKDYNEWKEKQAKFTSRGNMKYQFRKNDYGVVASKSEIFKTEMNTKIAQRHAEQLQKEAFNKPFIAGGKVQGTQGQQMLQMAKPSVGGVSVPPSFDFDKIRTKEHYEKKSKAMEKRANPENYDKRKQLMKTNFLNILALSFNSEAQRLINEIEQIPADDFLEMYNMFAEFDFDRYDSDGQDVNADAGTIAQMLTYVEQYKKKQINFDLKGF